MSEVKYEVGMIIEFGRPNGEKTKGEIVKVNPKKLKVKQIGQRGTRRSYKEGSVWTVPKSKSIVKIISQPQMKEDLGVVNHVLIHRMVDKV